MLERNPLKILQIVSVLCLLGLAACAPKHTQTSKPTGPLQERESQWHPEKVRLVCDDPNRCPENHGALLIAEESTSENFVLGVKTVSFSVVRCTAFAFEPHKLLTAGHCADDFGPARKAYFVTAEKPGRPSRLFHIKAVLEKRDSDEDHLTPDYAVFETVEEMDFSFFAHPALHVPPDLNRLSAVVVNFANPKKPDDHHLILQTFNCAPMQANIMAPIEFKSSPDTFFVQDCPLDVGNSGGAMTLQDDLNAVLGVIKVKRPVGVTNMLCIDLPGWPIQNNQCLRLNKDVNKKAAEPFWRAEYGAKTKEILDKWVASSESSLTIGGRRLWVGALAILAPRRPVFDDSFEPGDLELVLVPVPLCWQRSKPTATQNAELAWTNPLYEYGIDRFNHLKFTPTDRLDVTKITVEHGVLNLDFSELEQNFILDDDVKNELSEIQKNLSTNDISVCNGSEKELYLKNISPSYQ